MCLPSHLDCEENDWLEPVDCRYSPRQVDGLAGNNSRLAGQARPGSKLLLPWAPINQHDRMGCVGNNLHRLRSVRMVCSRHLRCVDVLVGIQILLEPPANSKTTLSIRTDT